MERKETIWNGEGLDETERNKMERSGTRWNGGGKTERRVTRWNGEDPN